MVQFLVPFQQCHPEQSRFSGEAKDLLRIGPARKPDWTLGPSRAAKRCPKYIGSQSREVVPTNAPSTTFSTRAHSQRFAACCPRKRSFR